MAGAGILRSLGVGWKGVGFYLYYFLGGPY